MDKGEKAVSVKNAETNCCQAVLLAFAEETDFDEATLRALGAAFGGGMGGHQATCGALCGAQMVLGLKAFRGERITPTAKLLMEEFERRVGAARCEDIRGDRTGVPTCSCENAVRYAAEIAEEFIRK